VREEQSALHGFLPGDACDDGDEDKDDQGRLTEYFTSHLINASPHPIRDLTGNALYNSESDLVSSLRTLVYSPSSHYSALYLGHAHVLARKDVAFFGQKDEYVVSGSDDGNFFIWDARSAQIVNILAGSSGIVNVIVGHPRMPILGAARAARRVGIFGVEGGRTRGGWRMEDLNEILVRSRVTSQGSGSYNPS